MTAEAIPAIPPPNIITFWELCSEICAWEFIFYILSLISNLDKAGNFCQVFLSIFNCHVNRSPVSGKVTQIFYKAGKFLNASLDKASEDNERNYIRLNNANGEDLVLVQIAGLVARRIVCDVNEKDEIKQGERFGIIRFGSRVDLYFENYELLVQKNQISVSGETLIAKKR